MPSTLDDLSFRLSDLGLFDQSELKDFLNSLPESERPKDAEGFLQALVRGKRLTTYQAMQIGAGQGQSLVLGNYVILDKLGQGGMGEVFKAQHLRMQRVVALKLLSAQVTRDPAALKRFQREVVAAARLVHPNIVTAYDADEAKGTHFLIMEHVAGRDLARLVRETGTLSVPQAVRCILQAARGLEYAHAHGVVHRDVKPSNLLLEAGGAVKVLDLGLARLDSFAGNQDELTWTGDIMGTVDYMAPEQGENTKLADARSDVYSLGMTLWFLLTGRPSYERDSLASKLVAHRTAPIPLLIEARPDAAPELSEIFQRLVAKDPRERYQTMTQAIAALEEHLGVLSDATRAVSDDNELTVRLASINQREEETVVFVKPTAPSTHRLEGLEPTLQMASRGSVEQRPPEKNRTPLALALAFVGGAAMILLTVFLLMPNRGGNVLIEVTEPDVTLSIDNGKVNISGTIRQKLNLKTGEHELAVTRGEAELTQKFTVGKKATTLLVEVVNGVLQVKQDGQVLGQVKLATINGAAPALPDGKFTLEFAPGSKVEVASLKLDRNGELTLEAYVTTAEVGAGKSGVLLGTPLQFALHLDPQTNRVSLESNHNDGEHRIGPLEIMPGRRMHVAAVRAAGEHRLYLEGILVGREQIESPLVESKEPFTIGGQFAGSIEEVRVSKVVRYDDGFTPSEKFEPDGSTLALYHVNNGGGAELDDASGNSHTGMIEEAKWVTVDAARASAVPARARAAAGLSFDGQGDHVRIPAIPFEPREPITVEAWFTTKAGDKPNAATVAAKTDSLISAYNPANKAGFTLIVDRPKEAWFFIRHDERYSDSNFYWFTREDKRADYFGVRHHAALVWDGNSVRLFVDGVQRKSGETHGDAEKTPPDPANVPAQLDDYLIGAAVDSDGKTLTRFFQGTLEGLRISRTARYDADFSPASPLESDQHTLALYRCDQNSGNVLNDLSGNKRHGKVVGAKWVNVEVPIASPQHAEADYALSFDGVGGIVRIPSLKWEGDDPVTIECWARPRELGVTRYAVGLGGRLVLKLSASPTKGVTRWEIIGPGEAPQKFYMATSPWFAEPPARPVHVAGVFDGRTLRIYIDGKRQPLPVEQSGSRVPPDEPIKLVNRRLNTPTTIGAAKGTNGPQWAFDGELDEIRISKVARYDQDFVPLRRFEPDADTIALYHCDEGSGDVLKDLSGNEHHGQVEGGRWVAANQMEQDRWDLTRDMLQGIDLAKDGLVHDKADDTWKPGAWQLVPEGLRSGNGKHEIFRLPIESLPPSYSLRIEFEADEGLGALLVPLIAGSKPCYLIMNGSVKDDKRQAGFGDIDGQGSHRNETTVSHVPCNLHERHYAQIDVKTSETETDLIALLDGKVLTRYKGPTERLGVKGFQTSYDGQSPRLSIGAMEGNYLFRRVELRTDTPATLSGAARDREIAAWVLARGGAVGVEHMVPERWQFIRQANELPREAFLLRQVNLSEVKEFRADEFARLQGADRLVGLYLENTAIDDTAAPHVVRFPCLRALSVDGTKMKSSSLARLGELRNLNHVRIASDQIDDRFAFCRALPKLRMLTLTGKLDVDLTELAPFENLREVHLIDRDSVEGVAVAAMQKQNPQCRVIFGNSDQARSAGVDPVLEGLRRLVGKGAMIRGTPYRFAAVQPLTDEVLAGEQAWSVDSVEIPGSVRLTDEERELLVRASFMSFGVFVAGQEKSDELARRLAENNNLTLARFTDCDFSDAGLAGLYHLVGLHELNVTKTLVTQAGINAFRAAVPGCQIISDFGTLPPSFTTPAPVKATRAAAPLPANFTNRLGMKFALLPKGKRLLGGGGGKPGDQEFEVKDDFYLGTHEVTQAEWEAVLGENPSHYSRKGAGKDAVQDFSDDDLSRFPVENVSWINIQKFLVRLNERASESGWEYRLPTQAEWEYACRGGPQRPGDLRQYFYYADEPTDSLATDKANFAGTQLKRTCPVGSYPANRLGFFDMHGNVGEWTDDEVARSPQDAPDVSFRMSMGGGLNTPRQSCTAASRWRHASTDRFFNLGFRLARVPVEKPIPSTADAPLTDDFALALNGTSRYQDQEIYKGMGVKKIVVIGSPRKK